MKWLYSVLIALTLIASPIAFTGCGSPIATTTKIAGTTSITVDAAMQAWGDYVRAGKATVDQRTNVRAAYTKYQVSMRVAESAALAALTAPEGQPVYQKALAAAAAASTDLIVLIESFNKKGK